MFNVTHLIQTGGLLLIALIIFSETGLMLGFFLPGDTLLLSAGVLAAGGKLDIASVLIVVAVAAVLGDNVGYHIGHRLGRRLFHKPDSIIFRKEHIEQFYASMARQEELQKAKGLTNYQVVREMVLEAGDKGEQRIW